MQKPEAEGSQRSGIYVGVRGKGEGVRVAGRGVEVCEGITIVDVVVGRGSGG